MGSNPLEAIFNNQEAAELAPATKLVGLSTWARNWLKENGFKPIEEEDNGKILGLPLYIYENKDGVKVWENHHKDVFAKNLDGVVALTYLTHKDSILIDSTWDDEEISKL